MLSSPSAILNSNSRPSGTPSRVPASNTDALRSRNKKKDDQIRKKAEQELKRKPSFRKNAELGTAYSGRVRPGTVASLRPLAAIIISENTFISQAAMLMATKKADSVLIVDGSGNLSGILTDKDIAYRVVAENLEARSIMVSQVMTCNPTSVFESDNRNEALSIMTERKFRHLPVLSQQTFIDEDSTVSKVPENNVLGLLDITKCVFERLRELEKRVDEDSHIIHAMETLEKHGTIQSSFAHSVRSSHGCPDLHEVLSSQKSVSGGFPSSTIKSTVREAAKCMKAHHSTGVVILDEDEKLVGIFTTKDIVLRVIASGLDSATTSVVRVMTHNPDSVDVSTTILQALKRMHAHHYLHLPVVDGSHVCGLVDVQQLTMAMLTYLMGQSESANGQQSSGPMWSNFWNATLDSQNESHLETEFDKPLLNPKSNALLSVISSKTPSENNDAESSAPLMSIKLRDSIHNRVFRISHRIESATQLLILIQDKLGISDFGSNLFYMDDENDLVNIATEQDIHEALEMCYKMKWRKLVLHFGSVPTNGITADSLMFEEEESFFVENITNQKPKRDVKKDVVEVLGSNAAKITISATIILLTAFVVARIFKQ